MLQEQNFRLGGCITFWSAGPTSRDLLKRRMEDLGLEFEPKQRTPASALKNALNEYGSQKAKKGQSAFVANNKKPSINGFSVIQVESEEDRAYPVHDFSARVDDQGTVHISNGYADSGEIQKLFDTFMATLSGAALGQAMIDLLKTIGGTPLRESGGVYWIPETHVAVWRKVCEACEKAALKDGGNKAYLVRVAMDEGSMRAIRDAVVEEVKTAATALMDDLTNGKEHSEKFYDARRDKITALHQRVKFIESELSTSLQSLTDVVNLAEQAYSISAMAVLGGC